MSVPTITVGPASGGVGSTWIQLTVTDSGDELRSPADYSLPVVNNPYSPQYHATVDLTTGNNTLTIPSETGVLVMYPPATASTLTLKGVAGDTGIALCNNGAPIMIPFDYPPPASIVVYASAPVVGCRVLFC